MASSSLLSLYAGSGRKRRGGGRSAAAVKRLLSRLRSTWRRRAVRPRRAAVTFGYDLHSYRQNFDDGLGSCGHRRL